MKHIEKDGFGAFQTESGLYTYEVTSKTRKEVEDSVAQNKISDEWEDFALSVGRFKVLPNGKNNDLPKIIRSALNANHLAPRILTKRLFLTWGQGPALYQYELDEEGLMRKKFVEDPEVLAWLKASNYRKNLRKAIIDFNHGESVVHKIYPNRGIRINRQSKIVKVEHVPSDTMRLAYVVSDPKEEPTHGLLGKWNKVFHGDYKAYPLLDESNLATGKVGVLFSYIDAYAQRYYPHPDIISALPWIRRSSAIPFVLETFTKNNLTIRWHIKVPQKYWDSQKEIIRARCKETGELFTEKKFIEFKKQRFRDVSAVLSGAENTGKFITTDSIFEVLSDRHLVEHAWEFEPIDQKVKDFVDANLSISKRADLNTISGLGLHAALSNVSAEGKADSGSEQLYALRNYMLTEVDLPEEIICEAWNLAIEHNWPEKNIRLGFSRSLPIREQDVTPKDRVKND